MTLRKQAVVWAAVVLALLAGPNVVAGAEVAAGSGQQVLAGEVLAVEATAGSLRLGTRAGERIIFLAPGATIWREGQPASLTALRPVANGFFHEALVWLDAQGQAMRVEGFYPGLEALVVAVTETTITLAPVAAGETGAPGSARLTGPTTLPLSPGCRVGRGVTWLEPATLQPGEQVYAVLNVDGQVKKIAAPG